MKCILMMLFLLIVPLFVPLPAMAQADAMQDYYDARSNDDEDRDRCNGKHDPACVNKTPMWLRIAWPVGLISLFAGSVLIRRKMKGD